MEGLKATYSYNDENYRKAKVARMKKKIKKERKLAIKKIKRDTLSY